MQDFPTPLLVSAVALVCPSGKVLMQQRPDESVHGGLWEFPGGKLEPGESPEKAASREIAEELGVTVSADSLRPVGFASGRTAGGARPLVILLYMADRWLGMPEAREAAAIGWYAPQDIAALAMPPLDYPLAEALLMALDRRVPGECENNPK